MIDSRALQNYSFFGGLPTEEIERIFSLLEQKCYEAGDAIIVEGKPNDSIYFITEGKVSVTKDGVSINDMCEGSTVGEMEVLDVMPAEATVRAATKVTVLSMSNRTLREIYKQDLKSFAIVIMNLARELSRRLRLADKKMIPAQLPVLRDTPPETQSS